MSLEGAKFICLDEAGNHGEIVMAKGRKFTLGYYVNCDFVLIDERAKGVHCEIECDAFGRVTIRNLSPDKPILVNGSAVEVKRFLLNNSRLSILDKEYLWEFPKSSSREFEDISTEDASTPEKKIGIPEQTAISCPDFKLHRELPKRFTVHNFAYCIQSDEEGNISSDLNNESNTKEILSRQNENPIQDDNDKNDNENKNILETNIKDNDNQKRSVTPESSEKIETSISTLLETPKLNLINCTKDKENKSTEKKNNQLLTKCHQSDVVITSFSPRETGVKIEKSFAAIVRPKVLVTKPPTTPKSVYSTPKSELIEIVEDNSMDLITFYTPSTSKKDCAGPCMSTASKVLKNSSMHLIDLTTPNKLKPSTPYLKSALKSSAKKILTQCADKSSSKLTSEEKLGLRPLPLTPVISESNNSPLETPCSIISVSSVDNSSVIEVTSDASSMGITPITSTVLKTPTKTLTQTAGACTPKRTPQSLMKRALLTSAKKQTTTPQKNLNKPVTPQKESINRIPLRCPVPRTPVTPQQASASNRSSSLLPRRQSMSTPTRKSISTRNRFDSTPSSSKLATALTKATRRSSLNPISGALNLQTSTPMNSSKTNTSLRNRTASKTSPLHKVRKSISGIPLSSHISKARTATVLPASTSKITSIKEKSPQQIMSNRLVSRALKSLQDRAQNRMTESKTPRQTSKASKSEGKALDHQKATLLVELPENLSRTFVVDSDEDETAIKGNEKKSKDATFTPVKDNAVNLDIIENNVSLKEHENVEIPVDVDEISDMTKNHHEHSNVQNVVDPRSIDITDNSESFDKVKSLVTEESFAEIINITPAKDSDKDNLAESMDILDNAKESLQTKIQENIAEAIIVSEEIVERDTVTTLVDSSKCLTQDKYDKTKVTDVGFGEESTVEVKEISNDENIEEIESQDTNKILDKERSSAKLRENTNKDNMENNSSFANTDVCEILQNSYVEVESTVDVEIYKIDNKTEENFFENKDLENPKNVKTEITKDEMITNVLEKTATEGLTIEMKSVKQNISESAEELSGRVIDPSEHNIAPVVEFAVHEVESTKNVFVQDDIENVFEEKSSAYVKSESKDDISANDKEAFKHEITPAAIDNNQYKTETINEIFSVSESVSELNTHETESSVAEIFQGAKEDNKNEIDSKDESALIPEPISVSNVECNEKDLHKNSVASVSDITNESEITESNVSEEYNIIRNENVPMTQSKETSPERGLEENIDSVQIENNESKTLLELCVTETETTKTISMCDNKQETSKNEQNEKTMNAEAPEDEKSFEYKPIYEDITLEGSLIEKELEDKDYSKDSKRSTCKEITLERSLIEEPVSSDDINEINLESNESITETEKKNISNENTILLNSENIDDNTSSTQHGSDSENEPKIELNTVDKEHGDDINAIEHVTTKDQSNKFGDEEEVLQSSSNLKTESFKDDFENTNKLLEEIEDVLNKSDEIKQKHLTEVEEIDQGGNKCITTQIENEKDTNDSTLSQAVKDNEKIAPNNEKVIHKTLENASCLTPRRRSSRIASQSSEVTQISTEASFTPRRSARRASTSAETMNTFTPTRKSTRSASLSAINDTTFTPKSITRRRASTAIEEEDSKPAKLSKTPKSKTPRKLLERQMVNLEKLEESIVSTIVEEEEEENMFENPATAEKFNEKKLVVVKQLPNEMQTLSEVAEEMQVKDINISSEKPLKHETEISKANEESEIEIIFDNDGAKKVEVAALTIDNVASETTETESENVNVLSEATVQKENIKNDSTKDADAAVMQVKDINVSSEKPLKHETEISKANEKSETETSEIEIVFDNDSAKEVEVVTPTIDNLASETTETESENVINVESEATMQKDDIKDDNSKDTTISNEDEKSHIFEDESTSFKTSVMREVLESPKVLKVNTDLSGIANDSDIIEASNFTAESIKTNEKVIEDEQEIATAKLKKSIITCENSPKTPLLSGVRELLKTPRSDLNTPVLDGIQELVCTPKKIQACDLEGSENLSAVYNLAETPNKNIKECKETSTSVTEKGEKNTNNSPTKTPLMKGMRELLKTPKAEIDTPNLIGIRNLVQTPKVKSENEEEEIEIYSSVAELVNTPQTSRNAKEIFEEKPSTSKTCYNLKGVKELLKTPKTCATPHFKGMRELLQTPKVSLTPQMGGIKELMDSSADNILKENQQRILIPLQMDTLQITEPVEDEALLRDNATTSKTSMPALKGLCEHMQTQKICSTPLIGGIKEPIPSPALRSGHEFDKFLRTPTAKNLMIPSMPSSAVIKKSSDSIEISTEYDLNATNEGQTTSLEDLFKTPVPSCFAESITGSYYEEEAEQEENTNTNQSETLQDTLNKSAEEAFDKLIGQENQIHTPVRKTYRRKPSFDLKTPQAQSPFSAADILSDMPKTDIEEWIETLGDAEPPALLDCNDSESIDTNPEESSYLEHYKLQVSADESIIPETCTKVYLNEKSITNISDTPTMGIETKDPLATTSSKLKESETHSITPIEAEISGINLLDQTIESAQDELSSMLDEPLLVDDPSMLDEALVVSDNESETNDTLRRVDSNIEVNKEENDTAQVILELSEEDANDLSEPLVLSDSDDLSQSQETEMCKPIHGENSKQDEKFTSNETLPEELILQNESNITRKDDPLEIKNTVDQENSIIITQGFYESTIKGDSTNIEKISKSSKDISSSTTSEDKLETEILKETEMHVSCEKTDNKQIVYETQELKLETKQDDKTAVDNLNETIAQTEEAVDISIEETNVLSKKSDAVLIDTSVTEIFAETNITTEPQIENIDDATTEIILENIKNNQECRKIFANSLVFEDSQIDESFADEATNEENDVENETALVEVSTIEDNTNAMNNTEIDINTEHLNILSEKDAPNKDVKNKCAEMDINKGVKEEENFENISSSEMDMNVKDDDGTANLENETKNETNNEIQINQSNDVKEVENIEKSELTLDSSSQISHTTETNDDNTSEQHYEGDIVKQVSEGQLSTTANESAPHEQDNLSLINKEKMTEMRQPDLNTTTQSQLLIDEPENKKPSEAEVVLTNNSVPKENMAKGEISTISEETFTESVVKTTTEVGKCKFVETIETKLSATIHYAIGHLYDTAPINDYITATENNDITNNKTPEITASLPIALTDTANRCEETRIEEEVNNKDVTKKIVVTLDDEPLTSNLLPPSASNIQTQANECSLKIPTDIIDTEKISSDCVTSNAPIQETSDDKTLTENLSSRTLITTSSNSAILTSEIVESYDVEVKISDLYQTQQQVSLESSNEFRQCQHSPSSKNVADIPESSHTSKLIKSEEHKVEKSLNDTNISASTSNLSPEKIVIIEEDDKADINKVEIEQNERTKAIRTGRSKKKTTSESSQGSVHEDNTSSVRRERRKITKKPAEEKLIEEDDQTQTLNNELIINDNQFDKVNDVKRSRKRNASESSQSSINTDENRTSTRKTRRKIQKTPVEETVLEQQEIEQVSQPESCLSSKENKEDISSKSKVEDIFKQSENNQVIPSVIPDPSKNIKDDINTSVTEKSHNSDIYKQNTSNKSKQETDKYVNDSQKKISSDLNVKTNEEVQQPAALVECLELKAGNNILSDSVEVRENSEKKLSTEIEQQKQEKLPAKTSMEEKMLSVIPAKIVSSSVEVDAQEVALPSEIVSETVNEDKEYTNYESSLSAVHVAPIEQLPETSVPCADKNEAIFESIPLDLPQTDVEALKQTVTRSKRKPTVSESSQTSTHDGNTTRPKRIRRKVQKDSIDEGIAEENLQHDVASEISTHSKQIESVMSDKMEVEVQVVTVEEVKDQLSKRSRRVPTVSESSQGSMHDDGPSLSRRTRRKLQKTPLEEKVIEETDEEISTKKAREDKALEVTNEKRMKDEVLETDKAKEVIEDFSLEGKPKTPKDKELDVTEEKHVESKELNTAVVKRGRRKAVPPVSKEPPNKTPIRRGRRKIQEVSTTETESKNEDILTKLPVSENNFLSTDNVSEEPTTSRKTLRKVQEASTETVLESPSEFEAASTEGKVIEVKDPKALDPIGKQHIPDISEVKSTPKRIPRRRRAYTPDIPKTKASVSKEENSNRSHVDVTPIPMHKNLPIIDKQEPDVIFTCSETVKLETVEKLVEPDTKSTEMKSSEMLTTVKEKSNAEICSEPEQNIDKPPEQILKRARTDSETTQDSALQVETTKRHGRVKLAKKEDDKDLEKSDEVLHKKEKEKPQKSLRKKAIANHKASDERSLETKASKIKPGKHEESEDQYLSENTIDLKEAPSNVLSEVHITETSLTPEESADGHISPEKNLPVIIKATRGRKKQMEQHNEADRKHEDLGHEQSSKRRVARKKPTVEVNYIEEESTQGKASHTASTQNNISRQNQEPESNYINTNIISVDTEIQKSEKLHATQNVKDEDQKGRNRKNKNDLVEEEQQPTSTHLPVTKHRGRRPKETHVTSEEDNIEKKSIKKIDLTSTGNEQHQTPQRAGAVSRRGRKASSTDKESHEHITAESNDGNDTPGRRARNVPQRKAATAYHNYDETSDSEVQIKTKKKTDSPRKSLEASKPISTIAVEAAPITDASISTPNTAPVTTARGRTRKPTARVQQFLEEERAKAETPKKRALLAAIAGADVSTPQRTPAKRGRKPSTLDTEIEGTPQATKGRGRGRPPTVSTNKEESTSDGPTTVVEEKKEAETPKTTASAINLDKGRKGGRKAKLLEEDHDKVDEPPAKKTSVESESDKQQDISSPIDGPTPTRTAGKRNAAAAAKARIEEDALAAAALDPPKRGRAKKVPKVVTASVTENVGHNSEMETKSSLQKQKNLLNSEENVKIVDDNDQEETTGKPIHNRGARKLIETLATADSPAPSAKRSRKAKTVVEVTESETANDAKSVRGRGRKIEHQPTETTTSTKENTTEAEPTDSVETVAEPLKRGTRSRRK